MRRGAEAKAAIKYESMKVRYKSCNMGYYVAIVTLMNFAPQFWVGKNNAWTIRLKSRLYLPIVSSTLCSEAMIRWKLIGTAKDLKLYLCMSPKEVIVLRAMMRVHRVT